MPADERPRDNTDQASADNPAGTESESGKKQRSGAQIAAAGAAGAAVVGTGAAAGVVGAGRVVDRLNTSEGDDTGAGVDEGESAADTGDDSLNVFDDIETGSDEATTEAPSTGYTGPGSTSIAAARAEIAPPTPGTTYDGLGDDPRRVGPRGDSSTPTASPSATADATVIAATESGATGVAGAPSPLPTAPLINRPAQPQPADPVASAQPAPPAPAQASQSSLDPGPAAQPATPAPPPPIPAPSAPVAAAPIESSQSAPPDAASSAGSQSSAASSASDTSGLDVIDDVPQTSTTTSSAASNSASSSTSVDPASTDITSTGPAEVPSGSGLAPSTDSSSSSTSSGSGPGYAAPPVQQADPGYGVKQPPYQAAPPVQPADPGYGQHYPPVKGKAPIKDNVKDDDDQNVAPPPHYDDDPYVNDDQYIDDQYADDVVDEPVYQPYYAPYPGNGSYGHPQDLYGDPQQVIPNLVQGSYTYVYRGEQGEDYATIIRDANGNETITWWYGDPPNGYIVQEVYVTHDGYGNYTDQITTYSPYEVDVVLGSIYVDGAPREDPDIQYGKQNAEEVIEAQYIIRTWTDDDGNLVVKRLHRDGSGKIEITYGDGWYVHYQGGDYTYVAPGEQFPEDPGQQDAPPPPVDAANPFAGGPDYFIEEQFVNPLVAGFEPLSVGGNVNYIDPQTGASVSITDLGGGTYQVTWRMDPNAPVGTFDLVAKLQTDADGNYAGYNPTYYTGDVPVVDTIPNLGFTLVNGEQYLDPWQAYGFPAENASQIVTEDTVVQTWETPAGTITKTYYRDGSHKTITEHADGVVITYDPAVSPYPTHNMQDDDLDNGITYFASDLFGETYGHPADLYPNGPAGTFEENGRQVDYYPDGTRVEHYPDHERITWYDAQGNVMLGASVLDGGEIRLDVLPWPYVLEHYAPTLEPFITSHGAYPDPASTDMTFQQEVGYGYIKHTYEDGTEKIYLTGAQDPGWIQINFPDGTVAVWNGSEANVEILGSGDSAQPVGDEPDTTEEPRWLMGGPEQFLVGGTDYFDNPEYDNDYQYSHASPDGKTHFYQDSTGYQAVIQDMGAYHTVFYGQNPPAANDLVINVYPDTSIVVLYYPPIGIGAAPDSGDGSASDQADPRFVGDLQPLDPESLQDALLGMTGGQALNAPLLPANLPDYFVNGNYPNPEKDPSFQLTSSQTMPNGAAHHTYANADGETVRASFTSSGWLIDLTWSDPSGNAQLSITFDADGNWTPSLYNADEYSPPSATPSVELGTSVEAVFSTVGLPPGVEAHPDYPNGVVPDDAIGSVPEAEFATRQYVHPIGWVKEDDISAAKHTLLTPPFPDPGWYRDDFLAEHSYTPLGWVPNDQLPVTPADITAGIGAAAGAVFGTTEVQPLTAADPDDAPQVGELPAAPEFTTPELPPIAPTEETQEEPWAAVPVEVLQTIPETQIAREDITPASLELGAPSEPETFDDDDDDDGGDAP